VTDDSFRITITNADVETARWAWSAARDRGASPTRVEALRASYRQLVDAQRLQIAESSRAAGEA
jgi:hypothetical protein